MAKAAIYTARLIVDGTEWPVTDYEYEKPEDTLGAILKVTLADVGLSVSRDAVVSFDVGVTVDGVTSWNSLMKDGVLAGSVAVIKAGGDTLDITSINAIGDRWNLATRQPVTYYDPAKLDLSLERGPARYDLFDETGNPIIAKRVPIRSLDLKQVLQFAFVKGCGFADVITNIPNYPVRRFDVTVQTNFRKAAARHVDFFKPKVFADDAATLWIIDPDAKLPAGYAATARKLPIKHYIENEQTTPVRQIVNALLFTYRFDDPNNGDEFPANATDRTVTTSTEAATPSKRNAIIASQWTHVVTTTHYKDFHDDASNPQRVTRSIPWKTERRTYTRNHDEITLEMEHTIQTDYYTRNFTLLTGYDKVVSRRLQLPGQSPDILLNPTQIGTEPMVIECINEFQRTQWDESQYNPDVMIKVNSRTWREGLVLTEGAITGTTPEGLTLFDVVSKQPLTEANLNRNVGNDVLQFVQWEPIETTVELWRDTGTNQVEVFRVIKDELTGIVRDDSSTQAIADRQVDLTSYLTNTELLTNAESEARFGPREPLALDAGDVPYSIARPVADRFLEREGQPAAERRFVLNIYDAGLAPGAVRLVYTRDEDPQMFIITSMKENGSKLGTLESDIAQSAGGVKVTNA